MRTKTKRILAFAVLAGAVTAALALGAKICSIDNTHMTWTGETRQEGGKTLAEYKCIQGHLSWVVVD